jgi:hypothetical protein
MNAPTIDSHTRLSQGALPREDVCIDGVDKSSVKIKNQCWHNKLGISVIFGLYLLLDELNRRGLTHLGFS